VPVFTNTIKLQNKDPRWYRDKYLTAVFVVCFLVGMSLLWAWPPPHRDLVRGACFLGVAGTCFLVSPQRMLILASALAIIFIRGIVGLVLRHSIGALLVSAVSGVAVYFLVRGNRLASLSPPYEIRDYSYAELAIDCVVLGSILYIYTIFSR